MAKAGVTQTDPGLGRTVAKVVTRKWQAPVELCEFSHWSRAYIYLHRASLAPFDKARTDFFSLSPVNFGLGILRSVDGVELTETQKKNLAGVNLPNPAVVAAEMIIENTSNLLLPRERLRPLRKFLASNKYF